MWCNCRFCVNILGQTKLCCIVPCIFLGVALSECQSAWTWDLHLLPAGQRWVLRASRPSYALSWPLSQTLDRHLWCFHWDFTVTFQGAPTVSRSSSSSFSYQTKGLGGWRRDKERQTETLHWQTAIYHLMIAQDEKLPNTILSDGNINVCTILHSYSTNSNNGGSSLQTAKVNWCH